MSIRLPLKAKQSFNQPIGVGASANKWTVKLPADRTQVVMHQKSARVHWFENVSATRAVVQLLMGEFLIWVLVRLTSGDFSGGSGMVCRIKIAFCARMEWPENVRGLESVE